MMGNMLGSNFHQTTNTYQNCQIVTSACVKRWLIVGSVGSWLSQGRLRIHENRRSIIKNR